MSSVEKKQKEPAEDTQNSSRNRDIGANNSSPDNNNKKLKTTITAIEQKESQELFTHPMRHVEKQSTPQRNAIVKPM